MRLGLRPLLEHSLHPRLRRREPEGGEEGGEGMLRHRALRLLATDAGEEGCVCDLGAVSVDTLSVSDVVLPLGEPRTRDLERRAVELHHHRAGRHGRNCNGPDPFAEPLDARAWLTDYLPLYGRSAPYWTLAFSAIGQSPSVVRLFCSCQSIPLCYYRPCNCGGGSYKRFYHHTIPEHSLDSASGYFASPGLAVHPGYYIHGPAAPDWRGEIRVGRTSTWTQRLKKNSDCE